VTIKVGTRTYSHSCCNLFIVIFTQSGVMATKDDNAVKEVLDLIKLKFDECIYVKLCVDRDLHNKLHVRIFLCIQRFYCYAYIMFC